MVEEFKLAGDGVMIARYVTPWLVQLGRFVVAVDS